MEAVHVLAVVDGFDDLLLADVAGQGELYDEAVDGGVAVELLHFLEEELLGDVVLEAQQCALEAAGFAGQHLVPDVGLAAAVVPDEDGCQVRTLAAAGYDVLHFLLYLCLDGGSGLFSVYQCHLYSLLFDDLLFTI